MVGRTYLGPTVQPPKKSAAKTNNLKDVLLLPSRDFMLAYALRRSVNGASRGASQSSSSPRRSFVFFTRGDDPNLLAGNKRVRWIDDYSVRGIEPGDDLDFVPEIASQG